MHKMDFSARTDILFTDLLHLHIIMMINISESGHFNVKYYQRRAEAAELLCCSICKPLQNSIK